MTSRRSVPAGEVFDVSVLTAREGEEGGERFGGESMRENARFERGRRSIEDE